MLKVPGEPQDLKALRVTYDSIELEWRPPSRDDPATSSNIKGYEIHYYKMATGGGGDQQQQVHKKKIPDAKRLKFTLSELESSTAYKIQIFAYNMKGDGQRSPPLLVTTSARGLDKPQNVRYETHNEFLHIRWDPPSSQSQSNAVTASAEQTIVGYRIYFNNDKYEVDAGKSHLTLQQPKWGKTKIIITIIILILFICIILFLFAINKEYDRNYEVRISAKSVLGSGTSGPAYGQEAVQRISTYTSNCLQNRVCCTQHRTVTHDATTLFIFTI